MNKMSKIVMLGVLVCLVVLAGCEKKVQLTFVNTTDQPVNLQLSSPDMGTEMLGTLPPTGGKLKHDLKIAEDELPATCTWRAGELSGQFTVNKKSPDKLWVDIAPEGGRVRDKKTSVSESHKSEQKRVVGQDTVVE